MDRGTFQALVQQQSWLPTQAAAGIADGSSGTQDALTQAEAMRQAVLPQDDGYHSAADDPVLHKAPSVGLALTQYLSQAVGPWPVAQSDLRIIQRRIQDKGFGRDLVADGAWSPGWQAALSAHHQDATNVAYHKGGDAGFSFGSVMHAFSALDLEQAGNALVGFAKAIPAGARDLLAGLTMAGETLGGQLDVGLQALGGRDANAAEVELIQQSHRDAAAVSNLVSPSQHLSADEWANEWGLPNRLDQQTGKFHNTGNFAALAGRDISAVGTIMLLAPVMGAGSRFATTVGIERAAAGDIAAQEALTTASAYRGPGVVARSLGGSTVTDEFGNTTLQGGLRASRAFNNMPVLARSGPWLEKLADADGLYYRMRGAASAAIYKYPAARVAGQALGDVSVQGAKVRATAALSQIGQTDTPLSQNVQGERIISAADHAIKNRLDFTVLGTHIEPSINWLQAAIHPAHHAASAQLGAEADAGISTVHDAMQDVGFTGALQRATGKNLKELEDEYGGASNFVQFYSRKLARMAATHAAELEIRGQQVEAGGIVGKLEANQVVTAQRAIESRVLNDPEQLTEAIKSLRASHGNEEVVSRLAREIQHSRQFGFESLGGKNYMDASKIIRDEVHPYLGETKPGLPEFGPAAVGPPRPVPVFASQGLKPENIGLAHVDTLARHEAYTQIGRLENEWHDIQARIKEVPSPGSEEEPVLGPMGETLGGVATKTRSTVVPETTVFKAKLYDFLHNEFHISGEAMPQDVQGMLDKARDHAGFLGEQVFLGADAPQHLRDSFAKLEEMGYKVFNGTDIGHTHIGASPLVQMDGAISHRRALAEFLGISPDLVANSDIGAHTYVNQLKKLQDRVDLPMSDPRSIALPPGMDVGSLMALMSRDGFIDKGSRLKSAIAKLTGAAGEKAVEARVNELRGRVEGMSEQELHDAAQAQIEGEINGVVMKADIPRKKAVAAFMDGAKWREAAPAVVDRQAAELQMNPGDLPTKAVDEQIYDPHFGGMDRKSAENAYQAIVAGSVPSWYQAGASKIDYLMRSSMGFAGRGVYGRTAAGAALGAAAGAIVNPDKIAQGDFSNVIVGGTAGAVLAGTGLAGMYHGGGDSLGWAMANMPNRYKQIVNNTRFSLSPYFSLRRVAKTNAKMALNDIPITMTPQRAMVNAGVYDRYTGVLRRIQPGLVNEYSDDADRLLEQADIWGMYNRRHYEAWIAGHLHDQGLSDEAVNSKLMQIMDYSRDGVIGRSQLERSTNFVFFPFSFDKTLYKAFGSYLLDNPGQRLLVTRGLAAYDQFNKEHSGNPLSTTWLRKHLPVLEEVQHLNAFAHGISPGEFGGINRPLLNMFLPQAWSSSKDNLSTLKRFVPAIQDFSRISGELQEQGSITQRAGDNMWKDLQGLPAVWTDPKRAVDLFMHPASTPADPHVSTEDKFSQMQDAFALQRNWYEKWAPILDANARTTNVDAKAKFPMEPKWGRWAGEPISKGAIKQMIQAKYPAYDPTAAIQYAVVNNQNLQNYLLDTKNTKLGEYAKAFVDNTKNLASAMNRDVMRKEDIATYTAGLRRAAIYLAQNDGRFYKLYDKSFRKTLGPLEDI